MKKAAGVSDIEEVVRRFETQEETAKHLQELQVDICHLIILWRHENFGFLSPPHTGDKLNFLFMCFKYFKKLIFRFKYNCVNEKSKKSCFFMIPPYNKPMETTVFDRARC